MDLVATKNTLVHQAMGTTPTDNVEKEALLQKVEWFMGQIFQAFTKPAGDSVRLLCGHSLTESALAILNNASLSWKLNNMPLVMDPSRDIYMKGNVELTDLSPADSGVYTCEISHIQEGVLDNLTFGVYSLQVTTENPTNIVFDEESYVLDCHSQALGRIFPASTRQWLYNGTYVKSPGPTLAYNKSDDVIERITKSAEGVWECYVMHSSSDRVWKTAWYRLAVESAPSFVARWFKSLTQHLGIVIVVLVIFVVVISIAFIYASKQEKETQEEADKEFRGVQSGWENLLGKQMGRDTVTADEDVVGKLPVKKDDESSESGDRGDDSSSSGSSRSGSSGSGGSGDEAGSKSDKDDDERSHGKMSMDDFHLPGVENEGDIFGDALDENEMGDGGDDGHGDDEIGQIRQSLESAPDGDARTMADDDDAVDYNANALVKSYLLNLIEREKGEYKINSKAIRMRSYYNASKNNCRRAISITTTGSNKDSSHHCTNSGENPQARKLKVPVNMSNIPRATKSDALRWVTKHSSIALPRSHDTKSTAKANTYYVHTSASHSQRCYRYNARPGNPKGQKNLLGSIRRGSSSIRNNTTMDTYAYSALTQNPSQARILRPGRRHPFVSGNANHNNEAVRYADDEGSDDDGMMCESSDNTIWRHSQGTGKGGEINEWIPLEAMPSTKRKTTSREPGLSKGQCRRKLNFSSHKPSGFLLPDRRCKSRDRKVKIAPESTQLHSFLSIRDQKSSLETKMNSSGSSVQDVEGQMANRPIARRLMDDVRGWWEARRQARRAWTSLDGRRYQRLFQADDL